MIKLLILFFSLTSLISFADVGEIIKIIGSSATVKRSSQDQILQLADKLQIDDTINSNDAIIQLLIYPSTQITLSKNSILEISDSMVAEVENSEKSFSIFNFLKGRIRVLVDKLSDSQENDQVFQSSGTAFAIRGTEFELDADEEHSAIQVYEGTVEATDLEDQNSFKITKDEAFNRDLNADKPAWGRRAFKESRDLPHFERREKLKEIWQKKRERVLQRFQNKNDPNFVRFIEKRKERKEQFKQRSSHQLKERRQARQAKKEQRQMNAPRNRPRQNLPMRQQQFQKRNRR